MKNEPLFLQPVFKDRIWGGKKLQMMFDYDIEGNQVGECWAISAHKNGESIVMNGVYKGKTLSELWNKNRELFGHLQGDKFPLLVKILDANADLSIQVHPNDIYANEYENGELGKTECWYVLDCEEDSELIYGHHAKTKEELVEMINNKLWDKLLRKVKIKKGDFFYVPSGTIHALCKGTVVLEVQQSSDTTYRLYDYDRKDQNGQYRDLHIKQSIDVSTVPFTNTKTSIIKKEINSNIITTLISSEFFTVKKYEINEAFTCEQINPFCLYSVIEGNGTLEKDGEKYILSKGMHFFLPDKFGEFVFNGKMTCMVAHV
ncbi:mannose-6-phosphate isomerase, class I [Neobacillus drentensis]|uniref:mannose-6-phosphate isomerase, class I n=1 Tax=Neobacillus drentensis TaxID=220684 RepID=UPI002FFDAE3F